MTPRAIDQLNVGLMLAALGAAFVLPFELFLVAYAVLGPLHYLTEIGWLHERRFFTRGKHDWFVLAALALAATLGAQFVLGDLHVPALAQFGPHLTVAAFGCALVFARFDRGLERAIGALAVGALVLAFAGVAPRAWYLFGLFVTTIVHVAVFTLAFMLFGALKSGSRAGLAVAGLFVVCALAAWLAPVGEPAVASGYARASYALFATLNQELLRLAGFDGSAGTIFGSVAGTRVMRFLAFAYTYHYLNWFSKTSIIGWHRVHKGKLALTAAVWIASLALYGASYELGARWLFLLSFTHVVLEFPLNHVSFAGIGTELAARLRPRRT
ncbi:MAG: hypothetical protein IPJ77_14220 [Planctomycetes bacterium]|nr:hypothetical protein [Planctomycetota bacterium]